LPYGLLGRSLKHSHSPLIHQLFGLADYRLYEVEPEEVEAFVRGGALDGMNVTIPYKQAVMPLCDVISETARRAGGVNTLIYEQDGIHGYNTDYEGLRYMLARAGISLGGKRVAILGGGGASGAAMALAEDQGARPVVRVSRRGPVRYEDADRYAGAQVLINTTPVGMYPDNDGLPLSLSALPELEGVADMIYNPLRTRLLQEAAARGIPGANGLVMLVEQGRVASGYFQRRAIPQQETERVTAALRRAVENIVLIGMPGSGKSTVGAEIAKSLNRRFIDTDEMVQGVTGITPEEIIRSQGESAFREIEADVIDKAGRETGAVIATGGGVVLRADNRVALKQNGRVYWLKRPLGLLATSNRPLSEDLHALYDQRMPFYEMAADCKVEAMGEMRMVAEEIVRSFCEDGGIMRSSPASPPSGRP